MLTSLQTCFFVFPEQKYDFGIKETLALSLKYAHIFTNLFLCFP